MHRHTQGVHLHDVLPYPEIAIAIRPAGYTWIVCVQRSGIYVWDQAQNVVWIWYVQEVEYRVIMCGCCEGGGRRG